MSGIVGIIRFDGAPVSPELVRKMTADMSYRGPDGINHWIKGSVALGQCMMRTTRESLEENQPLTNEDNSLILVMDGRVDNWAELRLSLISSGARLRHRSDAEMVLRAYEAWGRECVQRIEGDFAFVIWDTRSRIAFCARDRVGNKPLHYHWDGKTFTFASELHVILALPWVKNELNGGVLAEFLTDEWHSRDETLWVGISRLMAAHTLVANERGPNMKNYWRPDAFERLPFTREDEYAEYYRALLIDVVRRMSRSDKPLACEVSGGLDSSAIFAVAEHLRQQHSLLAPALDGYTLDFHDDVNANELEFVEAVERHIGRQIQKIRPSQKPISWYADWATHYRDFPGYPNGVMGLGIRQAARKLGSRVLLTGVGGDEWLVGDRTYYADEIANRNWSEIYRCFKGDAGEAGSTTALWWLFRNGLLPVLPAGLKKSLRMLLATKQKTEMDRLYWLRPEMRNALLEQRSKCALPSTHTGGKIATRILDSYKDHAYVMLAREMEERLGSSVGIELRHPFWDPRMIQFAYSTPQQFRLRGHTDKALHRKAMAGFLPEKVLRRQTKADFSNIIDTRLREMSGEFTAELPSRRGNWVESSNAVSLYNEFVTDNLGHTIRARWMLWALFGCDAVAAQIKTIS